MKAIYKGGQFQNAEYLSSEKLEKISEIIGNAKENILEIMFSSV